MSYSKSNNPAQIQLALCKRFSTNMLTPPSSENRLIPVLGPGQYRQRLLLWIDEPVVSDVGAEVADLLSPKGST